MLNHFKKELLQTITNVLAYKTNPKIVVFESDDWGSIRMPSKLAYSNLLKKGIGVDKSFRFFRKERRFRSFIYRFTR